MQSPSLIPLHFARRQGLLPATGLAAIAFAALTVTYFGTSLQAVCAAPPDGPPRYADKDNLLLLRNAQGDDAPIATPADWQQRREQILLSMQEVMGPLPKPLTLPFDLQVGERVDCETYERQKISFLVGDAERLTGYLLVPRRAGKRPAVLCLHQTVAIGAAEPAGLGGRPTLRYAQELAERGYVALAVDYPNFGDYKCDAYAQGYASATMKGIANHRRAIDLLASLERVDAERLGVVGHSLGGHNSLFVAAFDPRIRCVVTCCGFCSFRRYKQGDLAGWSHAGYMPRIAERYGKDPVRMPFEFTEVLGAIAPRALLVVAPQRDSNFDLAGVKECVAAAEPVYELLGKPAALSAIYPDAEHDFPDAARRQAYAWFDRWIGDPSP